MIVFPSNMCKALIGSDTKEYLNFIFAVIPIYHSLIHYYTQSTNVKLEM